MKQRKLATSRNSVGQNTRGAFRALETVLTRSLNSLGVRYSHFQVLHILWEGDGRPQGELAEASYITDSSFAQVINEMVTEGLVERHPDKDDGRKRLIFLTRKGAAHESIVTDAVVEIMDVALEGISETERSQYIETCRKIRQNVNNNFDLRQANVSSKKSA